MIKSQKKTKELKQRARTITRQELWTQLGNAISLRSSQDQVLWSIFGTFWAANALLVVAIFTNEYSEYEAFITAGIELIGIFIALIWHTMQNRALGHIYRHETLMSKIEKKLGFDREYAVSADINPEPFILFLSGLRARKVMPACSLGVAIIWLISLLFTITTIFI